MIQRYAIIAIVVVGLGYSLYYQIQRNGRLNAENDDLTASMEFMDKQRQALDLAQEDARKAKDAAERDANLARRELIVVRRKYAELLDGPLPVELVKRLRDAISKSNGDMPAQ